LSGMPRLAGFVEYHMILKFCSWLKST
jgi:hypothetical protein